MKLDRANAAVADPPQGTRLLMLRAFAPKGGSRVARDDGDNGVIYGASVCTEGELFSHDLWADSMTLDQLTKLGNKASPRVKCRLAHPGLSSDGTGKLLARVKKFRRDGPKSLADLHFLKSASETPDGDLSSYVMKVAEESPDLFGLSAVVTRDFGEEASFQMGNQNKEGAFVSPDKKNKKNLPHLRIAALSAVDVVDDAAGNADGLFSRGSAMAADADKLLEYAFGLSEEEPKPSESLEIHPKRAKDFFQNFLARRHLSVVQIEERVKSVVAGTSVADPTVIDGATKSAGSVKSRKSKFTRRSTTVDSPLTKVIAELPEDKQNICSLAIDQHVEKVKVEAVEAAVATAVSPLNEELGTLRAHKDIADQKIQQLEAEVKEHKANAEKERVEATVGSKLSALITSGKYPESAREELKPLVTKMSKGEALTPEEADKYADLRAVGDSLSTLTVVDASVSQATQDGVREQAREELRRSGFLSQKR